MRSKLSVRMASRCACKRSSCSLSAASGSPADDTATKYRGPLSRNTIKCFPALQQQQLVLSTDFWWAHLLDRDAKTRCFGTVLQRGMAHNRNICLVQEREALVPAGDSAPDGVQGVVPILDEGHHGIDDGHKACKSMFAAMRSEDWPACGNSQLLKIAMPVLSCLLHLSLHATHSGPWPTSLYPLRFVPFFYITRAAQTHISQAVNLHTDMAGHATCVAQDEEVLALVAPLQAVLVLAYFRCSAGGCSAQQRCAPRGCFCLHFACCPQPPPVFAGTGSHNGIFLSL